MSLRFESWRKFKPLLSKLPEANLLRPSVGSPKESRSTNLTIDMQNIEVEKYSIYVIEGVRWSVAESISRVVPPRPLQRR